MTQNLGDVIAAQVRRYRKMRDLSVRELAEECARLAPGTHLTASSLTNIERGQEEGAKRRRRDVTVEEMLLIAAALQVPPALLIFPPDSAEGVGIGTDVRFHASQAVRWLAGDLVAYPTNDHKAWQKAAEPLILFREHDRLLYDYMRWLMIGEHAAEQTEGAKPTVVRRRPGALRRAVVWLGLAEEDDLYDDDQLVEAADKSEIELETARALDRLRRIRASMRRAGIPPLVLPTELHHVDPTPRHVADDLEWEEESPHASR